MRTLVYVLLLLDTMAAFSQTKSVYFLYDDNDELVVKDEEYYYIFSNKDDLAEYNYYKNNKFPLRDSLTGELDLTKMGEPHPYLEVAVYGIEASLIDKTSLNKLNLQNRSQFVKNFNKMYPEYNFYFVKKIDEKHYNVSPMYIHIQE